MIEMVVYLQPSIYQKPLPSQTTTRACEITEDPISQIGILNLYHITNLSNSHHINTTPATTAASKAPVAPSNAAAPPVKVAVGPATLVKVPAVGAGVGLTPFGFGVGGIG